ncbi:uncharacterized protein LOC106170747 isoform X2 [Lingula anatina]|uniref:Uncharacterized protein LOC106170747 isoform X2 n=1 Tax=Lingula anatina TaxID=7574 RepID=A0A1S3J7G9_LINAN|nr:uncharacterized protein LOC106170747 isoform X2 [Lingula anatina]|eukprot:XP_013406186.1 uncharacterized protein LOC106170747 isoform X2 [Lingula anatina]
MNQFRGKLRPRPIGLPDIGHHQVDTSGTTGAVREEPVPYRLPRTQPSSVPQEGQGAAAGDQDGSENLLKLWSDCDVDYNSLRNFILQSSKVYSKKMPKTSYDSRHVYSHPAYSKYTLGNQDRFVHLAKYDEPQMVINSVQQLQLQRSKTEDFGFPQIDPSPSPALRSLTASPTKSIKWTLGAKKHFNFDRQGKGHYQGPFSRTFPVTCSAPTNWLRMKLGQHPNRTSTVS